ncbi:hypothetical protein DTO013E5_8019 [Penicillium roqueforti]|uniref:Nitroreductase-like n=1 Tax=Penicillium roqueforti (strain FM164) TaxID=1365484 RepID=W6QFD6_PENRF|nr:uncharacterized protein LCP9604111_7662 [Penicillium roqueforti]CDM35503.1 Nitroreductase-like [Penicillium roqueforti FM164]KAF9243279.1 hypothetical protein LCP9604111_7662 [Penicillium roqueforti]KAI1833819.1 hypothetical protein CBS147337_5374 [Penicillium roqueforti]KAI2685710.1 hypothetical protein CBS147355_1197 [Penicillium roqueforti]KAI2692796.1 hypothetical protein LCP963914a_890 [Penicillium roqueforti]
MTTRFTQSPLLAITRAALFRTRTTRLVSNCQPQTQTPRSFSSSTYKQAPPPATNMSSALIDLAKNRRTIYKLGKKSPVSDSKIEELVNAAILHVPSAFNTQSTRLVVLLHDHHDRLWDIAIEVFEGLVKTGKIPQEIWEKQTLPKLLGFKGAYGTILFYEDPAHIKPMQEKFPAYKDNFLPWADHSNAMHQYFLWTGLEALGFGANLQHYSPLIDAATAKQWGLPNEWRNVAQLVFGSPEAAAGEKVQKPVEERVKIFGKL